ncbi:hypothetical protein SAMN04487989_1011190 [Bizionia echini]|uniref:Outer membrane protein beta-barrel domain-containing protein n=1 Tax=Bizionia echini TaxID=649333 RepID=A0A1I4ZYQ3_9FLAO|nr:hypothetical protein [Bizionia echini]SFN55307.1 hypothetical protein SAMN04487989_1011190 [Bizionia echini]
MKKLFLTLVICSVFNIAQSQDANNPIDPSPTLGIWNRFYGDDFSRLQILGNVTLNKWFLRATAEQEFNYNADNDFKSANFLVARLFSSKNGKHQFGLGGVISYINHKGFAGGVNFVSVSKFGAWKAITLTTLQGGSDIFTMEFQPGIYKDFDKGWYFRSHPRMLFDFTNGQHEVPLGAGFGKILKPAEEGTVFNLFFEPQYDVVNTRVMLYAGVKMLF